MHGREQTKEKKFMSQRQCRSLASVEREEPESNFEGLDNDFVNAKDLYLFN